MGKQVYVLSGHKIKTVIKSSLDGLIKIITEMVNTKLEEIVTDSDSTFFYLPISSAKINCNVEKLSSYIKDRHDSIIENGCTITINLTKYESLSFQLVRTTID